MNDKIDEVRKKIIDTSFTRSKTMFQRNITVLENFLNIDQKEIKPKTKLNFLKKSTGNMILIIKGLEVEVDAKRLNAFTFTKRGQEYVGCIWLVSKVDGYRTEELGLFLKCFINFLA